jgi:hypothetical protein
MAKKKSWRYAAEEDIRAAQHMFEAIADNEELMLEFLTAVQMEMETGPPSPKELAFGLRAYFEGDQEFQDGFDEAMVMVTGWSVPSLFRQLKVKLPKRWFPGL